MSVHIFGIRHHGPGSARSLLAALAALQPDALLVEGPPEGEAVLHLLAEEGMRPPVAMLLYVPTAPQRAAFYPFAEFSPEWQALRFAQAHAVPAAFMDLPQAVQLAAPPEPEPESDSDEPAESPDASEEHAPAAEAAAPVTRREVEDDPIGMLAEAAGYSDRELWWERQIEQRTDPAGAFEGIMEAMTALRAHAGSPRQREAQREAHMRQRIRAAVQQGYTRIAVVCGAWHAPVLNLSAEGVPSAEEDAALLANLPRVEVAATWTPWTSSRLSYRSGYGAGIASPGWYAHLWHARDRMAIRWLTRVAHLLRGEDLSASSASVIEAVRLAETLAALRGLPMPGLAELNEAALTVLCHGEPAPMALIRDKLEIGDELGTVPPSTAAVPLQRDLEAQQRRLTLPPTAAQVVKKLDLREPTNRARSHLLHRLRLLGIPWGALETVYGALGTFHELWRLQWQPEFAVRLIEASMYGNTIVSATGALVAERTRTIEELPELTALLSQTLLADLPDALDPVLARIQERAALAGDVRHLMDALPALANSARDAGARELRTEGVVTIYEGLFERVLIGLPGACSALDDDAAAAMAESMEHVRASLIQLDRADLRAAWLGLLRGLVERDTVHGLVRGRSCRMLLELGALAEDDLWRLARLALAPAVPTPAAAAWVAGVVQGSGMLLLHQQGLWAALDSWLSELSPEAFVAVLPLLRRAFASFPAPERRAMGEQLKRLGRQGAGPAGAPTGGAGGEHPLDRARADRVLPVLAAILGVSQESQESHESQEVRDGQR